MNTADIRPFALLQRGKLKILLARDMAVIIAVRRISDVFPLVQKLQLFLASLLPRIERVRPKRDTDSPRPSGRNALSLDYVDHDARNLTQVTRHKRHGIRHEHAHQIAQEGLVGGNSRPLSTKCRLSGLARLAEVGREAAAHEVDALDSQWPNFLVQALDVGAQGGLCGGVVRHEGEGTPCAAGRGEADAAMALGAEEGEDGAGDVHVAKEVDLKEVVDVGVAGFW